jgi:hypothetical protein
LFIHFYLDFLDRFRQAAMDVYIHMYIYTYIYMYTCIFIYKYLPNTVYICINKYIHTYVDRFRQAAMAIKEEFGLSLFGFDVIVPRRSGNCSLNCHGRDNCVCNNNHTGSNCHSNAVGNGCNSNNIPPLVQIADNLQSLVINGSTNTVRDTVLTNHGNSIGIDIDDLVVIDVNYFPSYKEVPDFPQRLRRFFRSKAGMF